MLTTNGTVTRDPKAMANILMKSYISELEELNIKLGPPRDNYLQVLRNMTRQEKHGNR